MSRNAEDGIKGLSLAFPGEEVLALEADEGGELGCVTVFASVPSVGLGPTASAVRLNLFAQAANIRDFIGAAIVPAGFRGPLITASGFMVESWHLTAQSTDTSQRLNVAMVGASCCSEPRVRINPLHMVFPGFLASSEARDVLDAEAYHPFGNQNGQSVIRNVINPDANDEIFFPEGFRLTWAQMNPVMGQTANVLLFQPNNLDFPDSINITNGDDGLKTFQWLEGRPTSRVVFNDDDTEYATFIGVR